MKLNGRTMQLIVGIVFSLLSMTVIAGTPVWTFTALTPTTIVVPTNGMASVAYTVTNQSQKSHTLQLQFAQGITQVTSGAGLCASPFTLPSKGASCTLSLLIDGSQLRSAVNDGPIVCEQGSPLQCYRPSAANILHIAMGPPQPLPVLLSINPTSGTAAGGTGFTLSGTNLLGATNVLFDGNAATGVNVVNATTITGVTPAHAVGTVDVTVITTAGSSLLSGAYTYLTTAIGQPSNGGTIACLGGGLQNLIAATADNSSATAWGGMGTPIGPSAESDADGATNTMAIVTTLGAGTNFAAGICDAYEVDSQGNTPCVSGNTCYTDWFLPAKDQLNCFYNNLVAIGGFSTFNGYWSSTESTGDPSGGAWFQSFVDGTQADVAKSISNLHIRCARSFTP